MVKDSFSRGEYGMENSSSIIQRLREIGENKHNFSSDLLSRDKDNDGVIDRYDADERDSKIQEIGDFSKLEKLKRIEDKNRRKNSKYKQENERSR